MGLDHNLDFLKSEKHPNTQSFLEFNLDSDLMPTITRPTRVTQKSATLIDNVFITKKLQNNFVSSILIDDISDHFPSIVFLQNQKICKKEPLKIQTREINDAKITELKDTLDKVNWEDRLSGSNANDAFDSFHTLLVETVETILPEKTKTINYNKIIRDPWLSSGIRKSLHKQKILYQAMLRSGKKEALEKYKRYCNTLKRLIRHSKSEYFLAKCTAFKNNWKKLWGLINRTISKSHNKLDSIDKIKVGNIYKSDANSITSAFCNHFQELAKAMRKKFPSQTEGLKTILEI